MIIVQLIKYIWTLTNLRAPHSQKSKLILNEFSQHTRVNIKEFLPWMTSQNLTHINGKNVVVQSDFECNDPGNAFITILKQLVEVHKNLFLSHYRVDRVLKLNEITIASENNNEKVKL